MTFAELKARKVAPSTTVKVCLDTATRAAHEEITKRVGSAEFRVMAAERGKDETETQKRREELNELLAEAEEAEEAAADLIVPFVFRSMGREAFEDLVSAHKPTRKQKDDYRQELIARGVPANEELPYDPDTFPPALIAACLASPKLTEDEAKELWDDPAWSQAELSLLLQAAQAVNQSVV